MAKTLEDLTFDTTAKKRQEALASRNVVRYYNLCNQAGIVPEDTELYEQGRMSVTNVSGNKNRAFWSKIAWISLTRFSELQRGESIGVREIRIRLRKLRKGGYNIKAYSGMKKSELWNYLMIIRREVYREAEKYCPDVLQQIRKDNEQTKMNRYY